MAHDFNVDAEHIFNEGAKYNDYATINKDIQKLKRGITITVLLRSAVNLSNFAKAKIFCSTNLGIPGVVVDKFSKKCILNNHQIGDFLPMRVWK